MVELLRRRTKLCEDPHGPAGRPGGNESRCPTGIKDTTGPTGTYLRLGRAAAHDRAPTSATTAQLRTPQPNCAPPSTTAHPAGGVRGVRLGCEDPHGPGGP